jgi:GTP pyrophosphokinase
VPFVSKKDNKDEKKTQPEFFTVDKDFNRKKPVYINENNISHFIFPPCCHPIPGDDALGFIDARNRIEIHKRNCPVASKLKSTYGKRILDAKWDMHKELYFEATLEIRGIDRLGLLLEVTQIISAQLNVNIRRISIKCDEEIFDGTIELRVHDRQDVSTIVENLKKVEGLQEINQIV